MGWTGRRKLRCVARESPWKRAISRSWNGFLENSRLGEKAGTRGGPQLGHILKPMSARDSPYPALEVQRGKAMELSRSFRSVVLESWCKRYTVSIAPWTAGSGEAWPAGFGHAGLPESGLRKGMLWCIGNAPVCTGWILKTQN